MEVKEGYKQTEVGVIPEEWQIKTLAKTGSFSKGQGIRKDECLSGEIPCVRYGELYTKHENYIKQYYSFISKNVAKTSKRLTVGDILFAGSGETKEEIGKSAAFIDNIEAYAGGDIIIFTPTGFNSKYLGYLLNAPLAIKQKAIRGQGDVIVHISAGNLKDIIIPKPEVFEQTTIATALSDADALINSLEKLIAKKQAIKQGTMQLLLTGKKRLPGFIGEWNVFKLSKIFTFLNTANNSRSDLDSDAEIGYIHYGDIHTKWKNFLDCSTKLPSYISKQKINDVPYLQDGDLIMADASEDYEGIGACVEIKSIGTQKIIGGLHTMVLRGDKRQLANGFKGYLRELPGFYNALIRIATGISVFGISKTQLKNIEIKIPEIQEQKAISEILNDMTLDILSLEQKLSKYRLLKQAMMQSLLTGKIRLL